MRLAVVKEVAMNLKLLSMLLAIVFVVAAAGCGGGNSDKKANEAYASGVCTAIGTWATEVQSLTAVPSGGITKASLQQKLTQFQAATKTLISQIKAVPPPNTSEGQSAKKQIDQLATQVQTTSAAVKSAAATLPANATLAQIVQALSKLAPQFQTLQSTAQSTVKAIQSAGGSLADAFKSERSCKKLG
ncbi:MAG TPA: hypothetical protein VF162_02685 [Streptosporangiaceae bacterium]